MKKVIAALCFRLETLREVLLAYPEPHLKIPKSIKGDENGNHSNTLNTR